MQGVGRLPWRAPDGAPLHYERRRHDLTTPSRLVKQHTASLIAHTEASTGAGLPRSIKAQARHEQSTGLFVSGLSTIHLLTSPLESIRRPAAAEHLLLSGAPASPELRRILEQKRRRPATAHQEVLQVLRRFDPVASARPAVDAGIGNAGDDRVVARALAATAQRFVAGDKAMPGVRRVQDLSIASPREFRRRARPL